MTMIRRYIYFECVPSVYCILLLFCIVYKYTHFADSNCNKKNLLFNNRQKD